MRAIRIPFTIALLSSAIALASCGPKGDTARPDESADADVAGSGDRSAKAKEAAAKRAKLEALPPLPGIEEPGAVQFPEPIITNLENGLEVIVLEDHEIPIVGASLFVKAGSIYSPAESPSLAAITASLLAEGTKKRPKAKIDATIDATGGSMSAGADEELASISANVLKNDLDTALSILAEEATMPAFPEDALAKIKDQMVQGVRSQKGQPQALAQVMAHRVVYGEISGYGRSFPTDEQITSITREQVLKFYERHYIPNNAVLLLAGDITASDAQKLAHRYFGKWKQGQAIAVPRAERRAPPSKPVVHIVDRMASAQAYVLVVTQAPAPSEDGWLETQVLKNVLAGGTMSTRLNFVLREQLGLTYGAGAGHGYGYDGGLFWAGGSTKTKTAGEFADALLPLVVDLAKEPLAEKELQRVKSIVSGRFALEAEGVEVLAAKTIQRRIYDLPDDFWARYRNDVEAITPDKLLAAGKRVLDPGRVQIIAVGKRKKLEKQLAHLGEIRAYDTDLNPIK